jgi:hypothetical protein
MPQVLFKFLVFVLLFSYKSHLSAQSNTLIPFYDIAKCAYGFKTNKKAIIIEARFQKVKQFNQSGFCQVMLNDKWGIINKKGSFIVEPVLEAIWDFHQKYHVCPAKSDNKWGFINKLGQWTISPKYDRISYAQKSYFKSSPYLFIVEKSDLKGMVSSKGKELLPPKYDRISEKFNGHGITKVVHNSKYGLIDSLGQIKLPITYKYIKRNYYNLNFPYIITTKNNLKGLCSSKGKILHNPILNKIEPFEKRGQNCAFTNYERGNERGVISSDGKHWGTIADKSLTPSCSPPFLLVNQNKELLIIDPEHSPVISKVNDYKHKHKYDFILEDNYTFLFTTDNTHFLLLDEYGKLIYNDYLSIWNKERFERTLNDSVQNKIKSTEPLQYHCQNKAGEYGIYIIHPEHNNKWIPPTFDDISLFDNTLKLRWVKKDKHIGAINSMGEAIYDIEYDEVIYLYKEKNHKFSGYYALKKNDAFALFNKEHIQLTDFFFKKIWFKDNRLYGLDLESNSYFCPDMKNVRFISYKNVSSTLLNADSLFTVINSHHSDKMMVLFKKDGAFGLIRGNGDVLEKSIYNKIRDFQNPYLFNDIYEFKAAKVSNASLLSDDILIYNFIFEINIMENLETISEMRNSSWEKKHLPNHIFISKQKEYIELNNYEGHYKELVFSLNKKEESFPPFFSIKNTYEIQTGHGSILKKRINNYYINEGRIEPLKLESLFENDLHHQSRLSLVLLDKLKDLSYFDAGFCADESRFVLDNEYFTIKPDGLLFHFKDHRNKGSGAWKDRQYKGADIFVSYTSIGHLINKNNILYPLLRAQLEK